MNNLERKDFIRMRDEIIDILEANTIGVYSDDYDDSGAVTGSTTHLVIDATTHNLRQVLADRIIGTIFKKNRLKL